jgi:putative transposase
MSDKPRSNPAIHHRRSIRLPRYDYSKAGVYFITVCTYNKECFFGEIIGATGGRPTGGRPNDGHPTNDLPTGIHPEMQLNQYGEIVRDEWEKSARIRDEIKLGEYVIMPNHFHGIVFIVNHKGDQPVAPTTTMRPSRGPKSKSIGALIAGFKSAVTKSINTKRTTSGVPVWQRNYWEHIIRNEKSHHEIATYILNNPTQWEMDTLYPGNNP